MLVFDPTSENIVKAQALAPRLSNLKGKVVGIVSNGKEGTSTFFDHLQQLLLQQGQVASVIRYVKDNYSAPAQAEIIDEMRQWDVAISGIGD